VARRIVVFLFVLSGVACTSDRTFLSNASAEYTYLEAEYERLCVEQRGPVTCAGTQRALQESKRNLVVADRVIQIGKIPAAEKKAIKESAAKARGRVEYIDTMVPKS
jgi:hypothetical protein